MKSVDEGRKAKYQYVYSELQKIAIVQSIKNSTAIENIITTDERINAIVNQHSKPLNHDDQEIAGYRDVLNDIHINFNNLGFSEDNILSFHNKLLEASNPDKASHYKKDDNVIMEIRSDGTRSIRFKPVSAKDTKGAMNQLILAYLDARDNSNIN